MKKNITKLAIAYISLAFAQSISAETLTLKTGADNVITEWWNWSDTTKWSPTVSEVAGNDLTLNINNGSVALSSTINHGFHAGNVSISVVNPQMHVCFDVEGDAEFESLNLSQSSKGYYGTYLRVLTGHTLTINGDVNIQASSAYSPNAISFGDTTSHSTGMGDYNGNIHITGNLNLNSNIGDAWFNLKFHNFGNLTVDGVVNTIEGESRNGTFGVEWRIDADSTRIGGLQGSNLFGNNKLSVKENKSDRTLTFTNKSEVAARWSGGIINGENKLNIVMDKSAAGYQELDITSGTINDITLNGGTFYISSVSETTGTLLVDGGFYKVIGNGAKFANISLSSGGFIFEGGAMENGYTVSAGNIAKAGVEKIVVDFNGIYAPDYYGSEYVLISADAIDSSLNIEDANADFVAENLYDGYAIFKWAENQGKYVLSVTFSEVPEPAAISAIFGALALFLAFKRRKR